MFHPIRWLRQRRIWTLQLRLLQLYMEIERCQKLYDLLVSTVRLGNHMEDRVRLIDSGIDVGWCDFTLHLRVGPHLNQLQNKRFEIEKERRGLEFLIGQKAERN